MTDELLLSLCIPTNGVIEWVKPVLDSIYLEKKPIGRFEVIVTDNGTNKEFYKFMQDYCKKHDNLVYLKTTAVQFANQIEAFKLARGQLIKFVNHRSTLLSGGLNYLLQFVKDNEIEKPFVYFLDKKCAGVYFDFDQYVRKLSFWSSYSGGTAIWKKDFDKMDLSRPFNKLFPHINMILGIRDRNKYIIDGHAIMTSLPTDDTKKGTYNLFYAFAVEYPSLILDLYREGFIKIDTFKSVLKDNFNFIAGLYLDYVVFNKPCSYDLSGGKENISVYYNFNLLYPKMIRICLKRMYQKIKRLIK